MKVVICRYDITNCLEHKKTVSLHLSEIKSESSDNPLSTSETSPDKQFAASPLSCVNV